MRTWKGGGCQIFILLYKLYLVKWSTKGEGVKNFQKIVRMVYERPQKGGTIIYYYFENEFFKLRETVECALDPSHKEPQGGFSQC